MQMMYLCCNSIISIRQQNVRHGHPWFYFVISLLHLILFSTDFIFLFQFFLHCFVLNVSVNVLFKGAFPKMFLFLVDKMSMFCSALSGGWYIMKTLIQTCGNGIVPFLHSTMTMLGLKYRVKTCRKNYCSIISIGVQKSRGQSLVTLQ